MDNLIFQAAKQKIIAADDTLIISHRQPDGDACGSALALYLYLVSQGKRARLFMSDPAPLYFSFLPGFEEISSDPELLVRPWELVIFTDVADYKIAAVNEDFIKNNLVINFDHHWSNTNYGQINLVDASTSSTCELLFDFFKAIDYEINKPLAICLLNGLLTDTGGLINAATSPKVISVAADLLSRGANIHKITENVGKSKSLAGLKLWGLALSRLRFNKKYNLAYTYIKNSDLEEYGTDEQEVDGLANFLNALTGVSMIMVLKIGLDKIEGSLRTTRNDINVAAIAEWFGGGGHQKAAGFTVNCSVKEKASGLEVNS